MSEPQKLKKIYNWIAQNKRVTSRSRAYEGDMEKSSSQSETKLPSVKHKQMHEIWAPTRICLLLSALFYHIFAVLFVDITTIATIAVYGLKNCRHIKREWKENIHCFIQYIKTAGLQLTFMSIRSKVISQLAICNGRYFPLLNLKLLNLTTFLEIISLFLQSTITALINENSRTHSVVLLYIAVK